MLHAKAIFPSTCIARGFFPKRNKKHAPRFRKACFFVILFVCASGFGGLLFFFFAFVAPLFEHWNDVNQYQNGCNNQNNQSRQRVNGWIYSLTHWLDKRNGSTVNSLHMK